MVEEFQWPPIESNPEVFQSYLNELGLPEGYGFTELFGFDAELLAMVPTPVQAVIVNMEELAVDQPEKPAAQASWFMKQIDALDNACGIIACLHAVMNTPAIRDQMQGKLGTIYEETKEMKAVDIGQKIAGDQGFKEVHGHYAEQGQSEQAETEEDVKHHFIAFVKNADGHLIELDGMRESARLIKADSSDILADSVNEMKTRLAAGQVSDRLSMIAFGSL